MNGHMMSRPTATTPTYHQPLTGIDKPHSNDVLCGRGVTTNRHAGNESFRRLVGLNKELYVSSSKKQKMKISRSVVEAVRALDPPGRFLEKDPSSAKWFDIGDKKAIEKTSQALRDGAASLRKQLSQDLSDPEFLSAVFDMDGVRKEIPSSPVSAAAGVSKKKALVKTHRRVKSNPSAATPSRAKLSVKKIHRGPEMPMSPRGTRQSICILVQGKPPQSPSPLSPRSAAGSPRPLATAGAKENAGHRRGVSQDSFPVHSNRVGSPGCSDTPHYVYPRQSMQSGSFEYNEPPEHHQQLPVRFRSPSPHQYPPHPPPMSPAYHPPSPYGGHRTYRSSVSPRWSPRTSGHGSPHQYYREDYHLRTSPDPRVRPPVSPRDQARQLSHPGISYYSSHSPTLAVPALGGESHYVQQQLPMAPRRHYYPHSPRHPATSHEGQSSGHRLPPIPLEFTPPQICSRRVNKSSQSSPSLMEEDHVYVPMHESRDRISQESRLYDANPFDEQGKTSSPSTVADMTRSSCSEKQTVLTTSRSHERKDFDDYDDGYPSDEDLDPADDRLSPLPFYHPEDPSSLMELPENILSLPISPCEPHDGEMGYRM